MNTNDENRTINTSNIINMVETYVNSAVKRINDLKDAEIKRTDELRNAEIKRVNDLRDIEIKRINEVILTQKEFTEKIFEERDLRLAQKFESLATAINKAEGATEKRFESVNEFRNTLSDQQKTFISSSEYKSAHQNLLDTVNTLSKTTSDTITTQKERIDKIENIKQGGAQMWILIVGIIGICMGIASFLINVLGKV